MNIALKEITIRELTAAYIDNQEDGVRGYGGKLDVPPTNANLSIKTINVMLSFIRSAKAFRLTSCIGQYVTMGILKS